MSRPKPVMLAAFCAAAMVLSGCDRLEPLSPLKAEPSSVTVKLPPPRTATPSFAFQDGRKASSAALR
jgi:hypothetical protein